MLTGGRVVSPAAPGATALVLQGGRVAFVGADAAARAAASGAPEVDLGGRLVTPALVDAHVHCVQVGQVADGLDLHDAVSRTDVLERVAAHVAARPGTRVLVGQGWDERGWPEPVPPTRAELDRAAPGVAVYLARVDVHSALVSSALLERLPSLDGLPGATAEGWLTQDAHHACRGAMDRLFTDGERRAAVRTALTAAAAEGVATVHELGGAHLGPLADLVRVAEEAAALGLRAVTYWGELAAEESLAAARAVGAVGLAGDLCVDGAIGSHTAALRAPYADADTRGVRYLDDDQVTAHLVACTRAGVQGGFHCIGDDAVAAAVEGLRRAAAVLGPEAVRAARHRLEHVEMVAADDLAVLADLGVVASVQPAFDAAWGGPGELYEQRLGRRAATMNPFGDLHRAGVALALGTDAPVTALAGWATVRAAVQHVRPEQRLPVAVAFDAATRGAHAAARDEVRGVLAPGRPADVAVWDVDPALLEETTGLPRLDPGDPLPVCVATLGAGRVIHSDPGALGKLPPCRRP
ncbi:amidohydrolase [Microlunatus capsulatus]|uniref:Amidohydrolase YtcJ n=1 Tax=Microlunatus capsulatus TaxID=99117 RepID=A0ABS4Z2K5_9ACTN|nr:amidohydrolase family protein [Microlunatus capsulatus]MBP2415282.1 putative amidohydrolase YtcJ [Microlunatus capsulatus]